MFFTASEMELLCIFHAGTRKATIELLEKVAGEMTGKMSGRQEAACGAVRKLKQMREDEHACIAFDCE